MPNKPEQQLTDEALERKADMVERLLATANVKELPALNACLERIIAEQVRRDIERGMNATDS